MCLTNTHKLPQRLAKWVPVSLWTDDQLCLNIAEQKNKGRREIKDENLKMVRIPRLDGTQRIETNERRLNQTAWSSISKSKLDKLKRANQLLK